MKLRPRQVSSVLAAWCIQAVFSAHAFTLAEVDAKVVIGQPLEVVVHVTAHADEEVSAACVSAEVLYGDTRQTGIQVSVPVAATNVPISVVRVRSSAAVNEPVVTLLVRANCGSTTQRTYVLLAEFPAIASTAQIPQAAPMPETSAAHLPVVVLPPAVASGSTRVVDQPAKAVDAPKRVAVAKPLGAERVAKAKATAKTKQPKVASTAGKSVLKLDPLDIFSDRLDAIDAKPMFEPSPDALLQVQKMAALEQDVKTLRALAASNDAKLSQLRTQLQVAQAQQTPAWFIYGIGLVLLVCCVVLGWLLWQQRRFSEDKMREDWWQELSATGAQPGDFSDSEAHLNHEAKSSPAKTVIASSQTAVPGQSAPPTPGVAMPSALAQSASNEPVVLDLDLDQVMPVEQLHGSFDVYTASAPFEANSIRHISVEPILDIRQQAEFFVSLGQSERALGLLRKQIADSAEPNPLVYLDLISLYHTLGLKKDFRDCCEVFHQLFNGVIPDFPAFNLKGLGIEDYPEVLAHLETLWPSMDALVFLSACIFHDVNVQPRQTFELQAFRDLLMLHAMVEELTLVAPAARQEGSLSTSNFGALNAARPSPQEGVAMLDIDFSDVHSMEKSIGQTRG